MKSVMSILLIIIITSSCTQSRTREISRLSENTGGLQKAVTEHYESIVISQGTTGCRYSSEANQKFWAYQAGQMRIIEARTSALDDKLASDAVAKLSASFASTRSMEIGLEENFEAGRVSDPCLDSVTAMQLERYQAGALSELKRRADLVK